MRVDFYHLQRQTLEDVLPKLLEKAYSTDKKIKVKVGTEPRLDFLNSLLWTYSEEAFLPHGTTKDGMSDLQPIFLSADDNTPNNATFLFLVDGADINISDISKYERVFNIFDGNSQDSLTQARTIWKELKLLNVELHYWQQDVNGYWNEK